jgi:hypothetical protein
MSSRTLLLVLFVAFQVACGNPTRPMVAAAGLWAGTLADDTVGAGTYFFFGSPAYPLLDNGSVDLGRQ